jgi:phage terminase, large subunit, PBSX family
MRLQIPEKLAFLMTADSRYKVAYGGRGGAKSWAFADSLLARATAQPLRILCARELQNSIKDSVHRLLQDRIAYHELGHVFHALDSEIRCDNGSMFGYKGLRTNAAEIKSWEGADICWVEEAEKVSDESWDLLIPTIRKPGSEIWISFNTGARSDPVYVRFVVNKRPDAIVQLVNYYDNPWFPETLRKEMEHDKASDETKYKHIWLGEPLEGGRFFYSFGPHLSESPFVIQPSEGAGRQFGSLDYGYGANGVTSYGHWYVDGNGIPHRVFTWCMTGAGPAHRQARELVEYIRSFHWTSGVMPSRVWADPAMWTKTPAADGTEAVKCPADYFVDAGLPLEPANNNRVNGWQVMLDAMSQDALTKAPRMRYWVQYNGALEDTLPALEHAKNRPGDVEKCDIDHVADDCRYGLVGLAGVRADAAAPHKHATARAWAVEVRRKELRDGPRNPVLSFGQDAGWQ